MYDPLVDSNIGRGEPYPASYWADALPEQALAGQPLKQDIQTDIVVVGAGYSGLSCAYQLASRFNEDVTVLEANQFGWGCSGRNGGFVLRGTGRLGLLQLQQKFGAEVASHFFYEYGQAIDVVKQYIQDAAINCQPQAPGYLKVAHKASLRPQLIQSVDYLRRQFGYDTKFIDEAELKQRFMQHQQAFGAQYFPDCFGLNPLALVQGYARLAITAGAKLYNGTPMTQWQRCGDGFIVQTPQAQIRCKKLIFSSNGYTAKGLYPTLNNACLPVLSSIIVTEPLSPEQLAATGLHSNFLAMDTRALKYYYRKLPDNRLLFGGRSAIHGKDADKTIYPQRLLSALKHCFPALNDINYQYHWSGWVAVSYDDLPRVCSAEKNVYYAAGYCGSGLSFSSLAGVRLAELATGKALPALPIYQSTLPTFPLAGMRRYGQQLYYQWGRFKDHYL